jgi:hypothetical protein
MKRALWIIVIVLWALNFASSLFARVETDDYCYAAGVNEFGVFQNTIDLYENWSGRYSTHLAISTFSTVEPYGTRFGVPVMLAAFVFAWWYAFSHWYSRRDALLLALAFGAALVTARPNDEPIYWLSGATSYWLPIVGAGALIGALVRRLTLTAALIAFFTVAFSETGGALLIFALGLAVLFWKGERQRLTVVLMSAALGFILMTIAPGNAVRKAAFVPLEIDFTLAVRIVLGGFATNVILSFLWALAPGLFLSGAGAMLKAPFPAKRLPMMFLGLALAAAFIFALMALITTGWGVGERVIYLIVPLWLAQWYFAGVVIGERLPAWRWTTALGALMIVVSARHVMERAVYAGLWDARHSQILAGEAVQPSIGYWDSLTNPEWVVDCAEAWYGEEIRFAPPSVP